jgi:pilus assembly protein CpaE
MQTSNVCDYLDIEPRLRMEEIASDPDRLDAQLFDLFVSHHSSGLDVLASPRSRRASMDLSIAALDALFRMISTRYDLLLIDLPSLWFGWTAQVISACDAAIVTGFNNVPSLRQVGETLEAVREAERVPEQLIVGLNRCEGQLFGGIAYRKHAKKVLGKEKVLYVRDDSAAASHSINTGVPIAIAMPSSKITKDIRPFVDSLAAIGPAELGAVA